MIFGAAQPINPSAMLASTHPDFIWRFDKSFKSMIPLASSIVWAFSFPRSSSTPTFCFSSAFPTLSFVFFPCALCVAGVLLPHFSPRGAPTSPFGGAIRRCCSGVGGWQEGLPILGPPRPKARQRRRWRTRPGRHEASVGRAVGDHAVPSVGSLRGQEDPRAGVWGVEYSLHRLTCFYSDRECITLPTGGVEGWGGCSSDHLPCSKRWDHNARSVISISI